MGKTVAYVAGAVVCIGIGALVAGLSIYYAHPNLKKTEISSEVSECPCAVPEAS